MNKAILINNTTMEILTDKISQAIKNEISALKSEMPNETDNVWLSRKETRVFLSVSYVTLNT